MIFRKYAIYVIVSLIVCIPFIGWSSDKQENPPYDIPKLPSKYIYAGTIIYKKSFYAMDTAEIICITKLLKEKPFVFPTDIHLHLPFLLGEMVLWGSNGQNLVPIDVLDFSDDVTYVYSRKNRKYYSAVKFKEIDPLVKLMERIRNNNETSLEKQKINYKASENVSGEIERNRGHP
jgi:hypothetical protein